MTVAVLRLTSGATVHVLRRFFVDVQIVVPMSELVAVPVLVPA